MPLHLHGFLSELHSKPEVPATVRRATKADSDEDCEGNAKGKSGKKGKGKNSKGKNSKTKNGESKNVKGKSGDGKGGNAKKSSKGKSKDKAPEKTTKKACDNVRIKKAKVDLYAMGLANFVERFSAPPGTKDTCRAKLARAGWLKSPERAEIVAGMSDAEKKRRRFKVVLDV